MVETQMRALHKFPHRLSSRYYLFFPTGVPEQVKLGGKKVGGKGPNNLT